MGVVFFYLAALLPIAVGGFLWFRNHEVVWFEWLGGAAAAFLLAVIFHFAAIHGMTGDIETLSGQIEKATFHPEWVERYEVEHTDRDKDGNVTRRWTTTHYRTHYEYWDADCTYGGDYHSRHNIDRKFWEQIKRKFNNVTTEEGWKSGFYSGDKNIYVSYNRTGFVYPTTRLHSFENRIKAAPSLFSFAKVPTNVTVHPWPENSDPFSSQRLMGTASLLFDRLEFDRMNSRLGPNKRVNVIMVGFVKEGLQHGQWQEAAWIGGKKNDLVICFAGLSKSKPAEWAYVFGWTEKNLCKRQIESLMLEQPASPALLKAIEQEVAKNYVIKDWSKFDYITVQPPGWAYWVFFIVLVITQGGLYVYFHANDANKY
jgi:hypothetical protein